MKFTDLHTLPEDDRIKVIGDAAAGGKEICFVVDKHPSDPDKGDRYIRKLTEQFPDTIVVNRSDGPVPETETIKVTRP